jgi:hypothetical protein
MMGVLNECNIRKSLRGGFEYDHVVSLVETFGDKRTTVVSGGDSSARRDAKQRKTAWSAVLRC